MNEDHLLRKLGKLQAESGQRSTEASIEEPSTATDQQWIAATVDAVVAQQQREQAGSDNQRRWLRPQWLAAVASVVLMLGVGLIVPRLPNSDGVMIGYTVELNGINQSMRSGNMAETTDASATPPSTTMGNRLQIIMRPAQQQDEPLAASLWWRGNDKMVPMPLIPQIAATGAVRFDGIVGQSLPLTTGDQQLWVVLWHPGHQPAQQTLDGLLEPTTTRHWQAIPVELSVQDSTPLP